MISNGSVDLVKGDVLFVKPNSYISSKQIIDFIIVIIFPNYEKKCCIFGFKKSKYDDIFIN
jgi:hypothetical protein